MSKEIKIDRIDSSHLVEFTNKLVTAGVLVETIYEARMKNYELAAKGRSGTERQLFIGGLDNQDQSYEWIDPAAGEGAEAQRVIDIPLRVREKAKMQSEYVDNMNIARNVEGALRSLRVLPRHKGFSRNLFSR